MSASKLASPNAIYLRKEQRHAALIGCFVLLDNHPYCLTADHVIKSANNSFLIFLDGEFKPFGVKLDISRSDPLVDIGVFRVNDGLVKRCDYKIRNSEGKYCSFSVYNRSTDGLYGEKIFMRCIHRDTTNKGVPRDLPPMTNLVETIKVCEVSSKEIHESFFDQGPYTPEFNFFIESSELVQGDSGGLLFVEDVNGNIEKVGILSGNATKTEVGRSPKTYYMCTFIDRGLHKLNQLLNKRFVFPPESSETKERVEMVRNGSEIEWESGILQKDMSSPDWSNRIKAIAGNLTEDSVNKDDIRKLKEVEKNLSMQLHRQKEFTEDEIGALKKDEEASVFLTCVLACQNLYKNDLTAAEEMLKDALLELIQSKCKFRNFHLSKIIQLLAKLHVKKGDLEKTRNFFDATKPFMKDFKNKKCSKQVMGYYHMYLSKYLSALNLPKKWT